MKPVCVYTPAGPRESDAVSGSVSFLSSATESDAASAVSVQCYSGLLLLTDRHDVPASLEQELRVWPGMVHSWRVKQRSQRNRLLLMDFNLDTSRAHEQRTNEDGLRW
jgi:hypothetical protein